MTIKTKPSSVQPSVKIDQALNRELIKWLQTDYAKRLGFHSKAHFITHAVRDLMFKYRTQKYLVIGRNDDVFFVKDLFEEKITPVIINKEKNVLQCSLCEENINLSCEHVVAVWGMPTFAHHLSEEKIQCCVIPYRNSF